METGRALIGAARMSLQSREHHMHQYSNGYKIIGSPRSVLGDLTWRGSFAALSRNEAVLSKSVYNELERAGRVMRDA